MTYIHNKILYCWIAVTLLLAGLTSCMDDIDLPGSNIQSGETTMLTEIRFSPLVTTSLDGTKSRASSLEGTTVRGDMMDQVSNLYMLIYKTDGTLYSSMEVDLNKFKPELEERSDEDGLNGGSAAQEKTYCVRNFSLKLANGKYYMYAVANVPDLLTVYATEIQTVDGLRGIKVEWDRKDMTRNREMFGYFTNGKRDTRELNFEVDSPVEVSPERQEEGLHAWIRRTVSKITIDFDGSKLRDNVFVYIRDAKIYDIADGVYLGHYSCVGDVPEREDELPVKGGFGMVRDAEPPTIIYGHGTDYEDWPVVTNGQNFTEYNVTDDSGEHKLRLHDETAYCLPFYENMQGIGAVKYQDADKDGRVDNPQAGEYDGEGVNRVWKYDEAKDSKPNGTFVEVTGYYESRNNDNVTGGEIKFRFMIGKNIKDNFDCERNHHYKLTLAFKGNGNDVDWHIEYQEASGIHLPSPIYISYLYNKTVTCPVRINTGGRTIDSIKVNITRNSWAPQYDHANGEQLDIEYYKDADIKSDYGYKYQELGFLSLVKSDLVRVTDHETTGNNNLEKIKNFYNKKWDNGEGMNVTCGSRSYVTEPGMHGTESLGQYIVRREGDVIELQLPLYTRQKQLIKGSAYTGNNPYVGYTRAAEITVTVKYKGSKTADIISVPVIQVRRLVNPKGIYRDRGNNNPFHVVLMEQRKETSKTFTALQSIGPWKAYIKTGQGFISLDGKNEVSGNTLSNVDFNVNFIGETPTGQSRFAIIEILYHNYSCVHQIFVRQGDSSTDIFSNKTDGKTVYWQTYNMKTKNSPVNCVLDEGSLFRFGNWDYPIDACNNRYSNPDPWVNISPENFILSNDVSGGSFKMANNMSGASLSWDKIGSLSATGKFEDQSDDKGNIYSLPTGMEISWLRDNTDQAYGVQYGNDATGVQSAYNDVYGYQRDANGNATSSRGMRGCYAFVDNESSPYNGRHIFFPIGASGYGHRKHEGKRAAAQSWQLDSEPYNGVLRYAASRTAPITNSEPLTMPLFYDLYKRPGAIYWLREKGRALEMGETNKYEENAMGLDINFFTFDFNFADWHSLYGGGSERPNCDEKYSDACFIRCVDRK